jgi:thioesterase domain-containing protein
LEQLVRFGRQLGFPTNELMRLKQRLSKLKPGDRLASLFEQAQQLGRAPNDFELADIERLFHLFESHTNMVWEYRPDLKSFKGKVTFIRATELAVNFRAIMNAGTINLVGSMLDFPGVLAQRRRAREASARKWAKLATDGMAMKDAAGDHFTIIQEPLVEDLAARLKLELDAAD